MLHISPNYLQRDPTSCLSYPVQRFITLDILEGRSRLRDPLAIAGLLVYSSSTVVCTEGGARTSAGSAAPVSHPDYKFGDRLVEGESAIIYKGEPLI